MNYFAASLIIIGVFALAGIIYVGLAKNLRVKKE